MCYFSKIQRNKQWRHRSDTWKPTTAVPLQLCVSWDHSQAGTRSWSWKNKLDLLQWRDYPSNQWCFSHNSIIIWSWKYLLPTVLCSNMGRTKWLMWLLEVSNVFGTHGQDQVRPYIIWNIYRIGISEFHFEVAIKDASFGLCEEKRVNPQNTRIVSFLR